MIKITVIRFGMRLIRRKKGSHPLRLSVMSRTIIRMQSDGTADDQLSCLLEPCYNFISVWFHLHASLKKIYFESKKQKNKKNGVVAFIWGDNKENIWALKNFEEIISCVAFRTKSASCLSLPVIALHRARCIIRKARITFRLSCFPSCSSVWQMVLYSDLSVPHSPTHLKQQKIKQRQKAHP